MKKKILWFAVKLFFTYLALFFGSIPLFVLIERILDLSLDVDSIIIWSSLFNDWLLMTALGTFLTFLTCEMGIRIGNITAFQFKSMLLRYHGLIVLVFGFAIFGDKFRILQYDDVFFFCFLLHLAYGIFLLLNWAYIKFNLAEKIEPLKNQSSVDLALKSLSSIAALVILFIISLLVFDDDVDFTLRIGIWLFIAFLALFAPKIPKFLKDRDEASAGDLSSKPELTPFSIASICLGLASIIMPYFAAVFFAPAALISGVIAFRNGDRKFGSLGLILAMFGFVGIFSVSSQINETQRELERIIRPFAN